MENYDVVVKLIGPIKPVGETYADNARYENLLALEELLNSLMSDVFDVALNKGRVEYSMNRAGKKAKEILTALKDYC